MIRAVIVGAGLMGRWHADASIRSGGRIVAVVDPRTERARALAAGSGGARHAEALSRVDLGVADVVHVCTPTGSHAELTRAALEAGCHAIVEKPLASGRDETDALLALAEERRRIVCPVHQYLFQAGMARTVRALPRLGAVRHVDVTICSAGADDRPGGERDRMAAEILPHPLALLVRLLDRPIEELPWHAIRPAVGEIRALATAGDASAGLLISMSARPTRSVLEVLAENGTVHADLFHGFAVVERGGSSRRRKIARPFTLAGGTLLQAGAGLARRAGRREPAFPGLRELVRRCYAAVRQGTWPGPIPFAETRSVARAGDVILDRTSPR